MTSQVDVAIIGGGPAGSSCAMRMRDFGFSVALFEKGEGRRQHVGESLPSSIRVLFEELEIELPADVVESRPPEHFVYWGDVSGGTEDAQREASLLVWRGAFDSFLRAAASQRGAQLENAPVRSCRRMRDGHEIRYGRDSKLECRFLVDASGRAGLVARRYRKKDAALRTLALTGHFRTEERNPPTIVEAFRTGWVWSAPLRDGLRDVTAMLDAREAKKDRPALHASALDAAEHVRSLVGDAPRVGAVRGIDATPYAASRFCDRDLLLVGDAGTFVDPLSAHGVHKAMDGALVAAAVARTILERPEMAEDAAAFYDDRERNIYEITRERLGRLYAQETRFSREFFWRARSARVAPSEPAPPRVPLTPSARLRPGRDVAVVEAPVLENDYVERRSVLVAPGQERPVRFLGSIDLPELFQNAVHAESAAQVARATGGPFERAYAAVDWLYRFGYLELDDHH